MVNSRLILIACAMNAAISSGVSPIQPSNPEVALAPFAVIGDQGGDLRKVADQCLEQLAASLSAKNVKVAKLPGLDEKTLARAKPARWAVLGRFARVKEIVQIELRLMEVSTGDEIRSYSNGISSPNEISVFSTRVADRIALFVQEHRSGSGAPR